MFGIAKRVFLDKWRSVLVYIFSSLIFSWMYVALYPTLKDQLKNLEVLIEAFPPEIMEAFGYTQETLSFATIESLLATEMFSLIWPIILIILTISLANYLFAGDIEKGTIELTLAQPISRLKLFFSRYLSGAILVLLFGSVTVYGIIPLTILHGVEYNFNAYTAMTILGVAFGLAIYSLATFFSTIFSEKGKAIFVLVGIIITMYAINIIAGLRESLSDLKYLSFFNYFDTGRALVRVEYADWAFLVFGAVFMVATALALLRFITRDITV